MWLPDHSGIDGNKEADKNAKDVNDDTKIIKFKISATDFISLIKEKYKKTTIGWMHKYHKY